MQYRRRDPGRHRRPHAVADGGHRSPSRLHVRAEAGSSRQRAVGPGLEPLVRARRLAAGTRPRPSVPATVQPPERRWALGGWHCRSTCGIWRAARCRHRRQHAAGDRRGLGDRRSPAAIGLAEPSARNIPKLFSRALAPSGTSFSIHFEGAGPAVTQDATHQLQLERGAGRLVGARRSRRPARPAPVGRPGTAARTSSQSASAALTRPAWHG